MRSIFLNSNTVCVYFALILLGCRSPATVQSAPYSCNSPLNWNDVTFEAPAIYLLGEMHGTQEMPALAANFVCALSSRSDRPVLFLMEWGRAEHPSFKKLIEASPSDRRDLIISEFSEFWQYPSGDGRRTEAIMAAALEVLAMMDAGLPVKLGSIIPDSQHIDSTPPPITRGLVKYEALKAQTLPGQDIVVLSGNMHTITLGYQLKADGHSNWIAIDQVYDNAIGQNCMETCGYNNFGSHNLIDQFNGYADRSFILIPDEHPIINAYALTRHPTPSPVISENGWTRAKTSK